MHCSATAGTCEGGAARTVTAKQRNSMHALARATGAVPGDSGEATMSYDDARGWLAQRFEAFMRAEL